MRGFDAHTNSLGLRGPEIPRERPEDEFVVLCLGESVTFGIGLRDEETWPMRMEEALRAAPELAGRPVRVVNGAVPGWSSVQGMRLYDRLSWLEPDVVVFWFGFADSHEMRGVPDSAQRFPTEGPSALLRPAWRLRTFQLVEKLVTGTRAAFAEGTRVSETEFRENVRRLGSLEAEGGPAAIFVHEPERAQVTIDQLERVVARADETGAKHVIGPGCLLSWIIPAPAGADLVGKPCEWQGEPAIVFGPLPGGLGDDEFEMGLEDLRGNLEMLRNLKRNFDRILANLPAGSLGYADLFGDAPPDRVFQDNCHLTIRGARIVGARLAREAIARATARPPRTRPPADPAAR